MRYRTDPDSIPLRPSAYPFFYGWLILVVGSLGFLMSAPGQTYGVSPFTDPLIEALGLSRDNLSLAYMFGTIGSALCLAWAGKAYDRHGARIIATLSCILLGGTLVMLSRCDLIAKAIHEFIGLGSLEIVGFVVVLALFFLLRFSGQGVLTMVSRNMMMKWFDKHRGLVTGITGMVMAPVFAATPIVLSKMVDSYGWREAWLILAILVGGVYAIVAALFYRDNPEDCGLKPDGPLSRLKGRSDRDSRIVIQFTLAEARATYSFWVFTAGLAMFGFYMTGLSFHIASIFETSGLPPQAGYSIFLPGAVISLVLRPFVGWACDRINLKYLLILMTAGFILSSMGLAFLSPGWISWTIMAGNGIAGSIFVSLSSVVWPDFYGRKHLGAISGLNLSMVVFASAIGPWVFSQSLKLWDNYRAAGWLVTILCAAIIAASWKADNPQHSQGAASIRNGQ